MATIFFIGAGGEVAVDHRGLVAARLPGPAEQIARLGDAIGAKRGCGLGEQGVGVHSALVAQSAPRV